MLKKKKQDLFLCKVCKGLLLFLNGVPSSVSFTFFASVVVFSPWSLAWYLEKTRREIQHYPLQSGKDKLIELQGEQPRGCLIYGLNYSVGLLQCMR